MGGAKTASLLLYYPDSVRPQPTTYDFFIVLQKSVQGQIALFAGMDGQGFVQEQFLPFLFQFKCKNPGAILVIAEEVVGHFHLHDFHFPKSYFFLVVLIKLAQFAAVNEYHSGPVRLGGFDAIGEFLRR